MPVIVVPRPEHARQQPLAELAARLGLPAPEAAVSISGVTHDSRAVRAGDLYAALPGSRTHGARFVPEAVRNGAVAVLTDPSGAADGRTAGVPVLAVDDPRAVLGDVAAWAYDDPTARLLVLGVTGTNGKTTTAHLLEAGLAAAGHITGLIGTIETRIAAETEPSQRTTPEATDLQALFALMLERGVSAVAMEVSSHALALHRVDGTRFAAGLFTNMSQDHLDFHADMEAYFAAKAMLFDGRCRHEVVNVDDQYGRRLVKPSTVTVSPGGRPDATWRVTDVRADATGRPTFTVLGPDGANATASVRSPGLFSVANALLAIAALVTIGVPLTDAVRGTAALEVPGRMEPVDRGQGFLAVVDYAHTPEAVAAALAALRPMTSGRMIVVLGCGGDRDRAKRPLMGLAAARGADLVVLTDDNPRSEDPAAIRAAVADGARLAAAEVLDIGGRRQAIGEAIGRARPGDSVLVAGKGHEQGQEVGDVVHPFDDRKVLAELLAELLDEAAP